MEGNLHQNVVNAAQLEPCHTRFTPPTSPPGDAAGAQQSRRQGVRTCWEGFKAEGGRRHQPAGNTWQSRKTGATRIRHS